MPYTAEKNNINLLSQGNIKKYVLPFYGLENCEVINIKFKDTDKQRSVYKIQDKDSSYCLKKVYLQKNDLLFVYSAIEWLYRNGIHVPKIISTTQRDRFVNYENMLFILTPWIEGNKCDYDKLDNLISASANLATMHSVSKKFIPIDGCVPKNSFNDLYTSIKKHFEQLLVSSNMAFKYKDKFSKFFLDNFHDNQLLSQISLEAASSININNLNKSLCHMDYVNKNIIIDDKEDLWVIDFDKCSMNYSVHDFSYFLRRLMKRENTMWSLEIAKNCIDAYNKIRPLNIDEYKYILVYLSFPQKYWKISRDYYNNITKCNKNSFYMLLSKACENNEEHIKFIDDLNAYIIDKFH